MGGYEAVLFSGDVVGRGRGMVLLRVMVKASYFLIVIFFSDFIYPRSTTRPFFGRVIFLIQTPSYEGSFVDHCYAAFESTIYHLE